MAKNLAFAKPFGTDGGSSWADDDDLDLEPLVIAPPKVPTCVHSALVIGTVAFLCLLCCCSCCMMSL